MIGQRLGFEFLLAAAAVVLIFIGHQVVGTFSSVLTVSGIVIALGAGYVLVRKLRNEQQAQRNEILLNAIESGTEGVAVFNRRRELLDSNEKFRSFFDLPEPMVSPGTPFKSILWFQSDRGDYGHNGEPETQVSLRLSQFTDTKRHPVKVTGAGGRQAILHSRETEDGQLVLIYLPTGEVTADAAEEGNPSELTEIVSQMDEGAMIVDTGGTVIAANDGFAAALPLDAELTSAGTTFTQVVESAVLNAEGRHALLVAVEKALDGDLEPSELTLSSDLAIRIAGRDSKEAPLLIRAVRGSDGAPEGSADRYALAFKGSTDCMWDWDLKSDIFIASERWAEILGIGSSGTQASVAEWFDRVHPADLESLNQEIESLKASRGDHMRAEFRLLHADGDYVWILARALAQRSEDGQVIRIVGSMADISDWKRSEEKLIKDALYDTVTGLPNRALFLDRIDREVRRSRASGESRYSILVLDLDRFKVVNDSLGHDLGDALLVEVARRLEASAGPGDSIARLSGDEFGILLTDVEDAERAQDTAHWLQNDLAAAFAIGNQEIFTSGCIGIAMPSDSFTTSEEMLRAADIAMYRAKDSGQSSIALFDRQMQSRAITLLQMENDLRRAIDREEIEMFYQPIVSLADGRMKGVEALARWRHPDRGTIVPADFIPLAEDTGLINAIGTAALRLACRQMKAWQNDLGSLAPARISVNLSSRQLQDPNLVREIELILKREGVSGSNLKLEVTESMIMMNPEVTTRSLLELKDLGVALSIDDFGTGYSSLSYLHRFPFDTLKIDRSFVVSMEEKSENSEIIRSITLLAHSLGMDIVAEGIETHSHVRHLQHLNCELGQGFYFASPLPADKISELIAANQTWEL